MMAAARMMLELGGDAVPTATWRALARALAPVVPSVAADDGGAPLEARREPAAPPRVAPMPAVEPPGPARPVPVTGAAVSGFLDGVQRSRVVAWLPEGVPLVGARVAAVVLQREGRQLRRWGAVRERALVVAPRARLDEATWERIAARVPLLDSGAPADAWHPDELTTRALHAVESARADEERALAERWAEDGVAPLCVDGSLAALGAAAHSPRMVGVVKSHRTLLVAPERIPALLGLPEGHRSPVVALTGSHHRSAVWTWYLRVRAPQPQDPLFGLLRVEIADHGDPTERADTASGWVLAERTPLALPDARWDVMPYGIARCEALLKDRVRT
jgi:hypothetical protein